MYVIDPATNLVPDQATEVIFPDAVLVSVLTVHAVVASGEVITVLVFPTATNKDNSAHQTTAFNCAVVLLVLVVHVTPSGEVATYPEEPTVTNKEWVEDQIISSP